MSRARTSRVMRGRRADTLLRRFVVTRARRAGVQRHTHQFGEVRNAIGITRCSVSRGEDSIGRIPWSRAQRSIAKRTSARRAAIKLHVHGAGHSRTGRDRFRGRAVRLRQRARRSSHCVRHFLSAPECLAPPNRRMDQAACRRTGIFWPDIPVEENRRRPPEATQCHCR
jgi:hypothetical protein